MLIVDENVPKEIKFSLNCFAIFFSPKNIAHTLTDVLIPIYSRDICIEIKPHDFLSPKNRQQFQI